MRRIEAQLEHGALVPDTEEFALKQPDRFKLKLAERINLQPGVSADVLASRIHDGIRYTFEYDDQDYMIGTEETEAALSRSGYELISRKPSWDSPDYKGVNSQWRDPDSGLLFEVQFHNHASWSAKQKTHLAYERLTDSRTAPKEREQLDAYQKEIAASVPVPPGALEIPYYHKKGD
jgi:YD repeat-containing protein